MPHEHQCPSSSLQNEDKDKADLGYMTLEKAYRVVLAGDAAVGKSSFLLRLCKNEFKLNSSATLGGLHERAKASQPDLWGKNQTKAQVPVF